ncbi:hypothetical protein GLOIN_2v1146582 [Rhizophagus clarus]|uniref:HTH myb-type domain-containing protein n=1 Tax=Rhizophagus clarus TaxID=94130 RepID=A0A8H3MA42_9GLOM|nr:hypothetical protein GLOIN_2v1146582 [Rhizophagus clarus]
MGKMGETFSDKDNGFIICCMYYMKKYCYGHYYYHFEIISELMSSKYTPSQISEHWKNRLCPNLSRKPLWKCKKVSIIEHIEWINVLYTLKICFYNYYRYSVDSDNINHGPYVSGYYSLKLSQKTDLEQKHTSRNAEKRKYKQNNFTLSLPSADNSPSYTPSIQNDSSSKISVESLINESIPDFSQIIKIYIEECNRHWSI